MSNSFKPCPTHFFKGGEKFSRRGFVPRGYGLDSNLHIVDVLKIRITCKLPMVTFQCNTKHYFTIIITYVKIFTKNKMRQLSKDLTSKWHVNEVIRF